MVQECTSNAIFDRVTPGEPPWMDFHVRARRPDGKVRTIYGSIEIPDAQMAARLRMLQPGTEIRMTQRTDWGLKGLPRTLVSVEPAAGRTEAAE